MNFSSRFNPILIGAAIAIIQPQIAVALTPTEISAKAEEITVRIDGKNDKNSGSGVIVERNGDNYVVITNWHVVDTSGNYTVQTYDGKRYAVNYSQVRRLPGVDVAILQFTSSQNYQIAELGNSAEIETGMNVYATGFPLPGPGTPKRSYRFLPGLISGPNPDAKNGYELTYTIEPIPGMSGGPIFNEQGQVVGIYGEGATDIRTGRASLGLGIPINTYKKLASIEPETKPQPSNSNIEINKKDVEFFTQGNEKYKQGDWQGAIADYTQAIKINPNYADAYNNRGNARSDLGDKQGAIADYNQAIKINPNYAYAYNNRGNARKDLGDNQGAIADYDQAIKINPNLAIAYNNRGIARRKLGDNQGAIEDYNQAIRLNPNYADAYNNRGSVRKELGDNQGAIADYDQAIKINPNLAIAYNNRGNARSHLGDKQGAIADYTQAIKINPNYADAYNNRGIARSDLGDNQGAIADYTQALKINPNYANAYYNRGNARRQLGDKQGAISDLQKAAELYKKQGDTVWYQNSLDWIKKYQQE